MKKIEYIWRELLIQTVEKREPVFAQQSLSAKFGLSSSTVNLSLSPLRKLGAVSIGKRHSEVTDYEKILYHWANHRHLEKDISAKLHVGLPVMEIEGRLPENSIPTGYTAIREKFGEPPSNYDKVYCYHADPTIVTARFAADITRGEPNLFVMKADPFLGPQVSLPQVFVDLWNMHDWYAKDFCRFIKSKLEEMMS